MVTEVYIEGQKLDLFDDETISITQGIQDVKDISKIFADFSQSFNVPASKTNNAIFKHYYNQDIDNGFDARTRKEAIININTIPFKTGKIQLTGVKTKNNIATSYSITFYGDAIKIKDLIGDDKLETLEWLDNFNHDYDPDIIKTGLTTGLDFTVDGVLYEKAVCYPLISYQRQYLYNSNPSDTTSTDTLVNISYDAGRSDGVKFDELKPAIKLYLIIEAIEQKYGINFVGGFFDAELFKDIYVNLNNSTEKLSNGSLVYEDETFTLSDIPSSQDPYDQLVYGVSVTPLPAYQTTPYKIILRINGQAIYEDATFFIGNRSVFGVLEDVPEEVNITAEIVTTSDFEFDSNTLLKYEFTFVSTNEVTLWSQSYTNQVIDLNTIILDQIQDIKTYEFLVGLFKTFNLIVAPSDGDLLVEDLPTWYMNGDIIDITPFIDTQSKDVNKGEIFNKIDFKFEESDQILADEFRQSNNRIYGNEELTLYTDATQTQKLDGKTLEIESSFENPIFERLFDVNTGLQTVVQYCPYFNREIKSISENPFMFYAKSVNISSEPLGYSRLGAYEELNTTILMPSHSQQIDFPSFNLNFAAEYNEYTNQVFTDTIYNRYYSDYIGDVFSNKRRNFKFKGILPLRILNGLKLNDRVVTVSYTHLTLPTIYSV